MPSMADKNRDQSLDKDQIEFLKNERDQWINKYREANATAHRIKYRVSVLEKRTNKWKQKAKKLEAEQAQLQAELEAKEKELETLKKKIDEQRQEIANSTTSYDVPAYHKYSLGQIMLFIDLVLSAATTFRGASRAMQITYTSLGLNLEAPSWVAGRLWVLRLGYYKLTRAKELSNDWVWIVDHTIELGTKKCLVILGIRLASLPPVGSCVSHKDVEPIALLPVTHSNGDIVYKQLEECVVITSVPRQIIADYGSDMKSGVKKFCSVHKETCFIYDIKHKTAALLRQTLKNDEAWVAFTKLASQSKKNVQQTALAFLAPPNQRAKARYMNVDILINWGLKMLNLIDNPTQLVSNEFDLKQVHTKLGWVSKFRPHLKEWETLLQLVITTENFVRKEGVMANSELKLQNLLNGLTHTERTQKMRIQLLKFVAAEASKCQPNERLLGSSEVIESAFGKLKHLEQEQAKSGFTPLLLSLAAMLSSTTSLVVQRALETVPTRQIQLWSRENLGESLQSKRKKAFHTSKKK